MNYARISLRQLNDLSNLFHQMSELDMPLESLIIMTDLTIEAQKILLAVVDNPDLAKEETVKHLKG